MRRASGRCAPCGRWTSSGRWAAGSRPSATAAGTASTGATTTSPAWSRATATTSEFWYESATALATVLHLHRGTPYVYQGEELGMTNGPFASIDDFRDIETLNYYADAVGRRGLDADEVLEAVRRKSRDNARTPMQWTADPTAGFTDRRALAAREPEQQVAQRRGPGRAIPGRSSPTIRALIELRHEDPIVVDGDFALIDPEHPDLYAFARSSGAGTVGGLRELVRRAAQRRSRPARRRRGRGADEPTGRVRAGRGRGSVLAPWEARVLRSG